jgi:two-component system response regulator
MERMRKLQTIIIAEDDSDDQKLIKEAFEECKILNPLIFAEDGEELMNYLKNQNEHQNLDNSIQPAIVLLDLNMPRKDGREVLYELKQDPDLKKIPIIILTTSHNNEDVVYCYESGASSFITKPVSFTELVEVISVISKYWFQIVKLPGEV